MKKITPSKENYLRVLLELSSYNKNIQSKDITDALGISKASVSRMMNILKEEGYILKEKYGTVTITEKGFYVASEVKKKRNLLKMFLINVLGVDSKIADIDACRMEHVISTETAEKITQKLKKLFDENIVLSEEVRKCQEVMEQVPWEWEL